MPFPAISRSAHAKLNLALSVGSPRPPRGYHPIASWMALLDLADTVELVPAGQGAMHEIRWAPDAPRASPIDWPIEKDLAVRALALVEPRIGPARVHITKRIPVGGGLGGGSSDAAAVLLLARQLDTSLSVDELIRLAATLGSDVPFFVLAESTGHPAVIGGFGEHVESAPPLASPIPVDLVFPPFGCPTANVYRSFDQLLPIASTPRDADIRAVRAAANSPFDSAAALNDLEPAAVHAFPQLGVILRTIRASGRHALIAGSGSTIASFGPPLDAPPPGCTLARTTIAC